MSNFNSLPDQNTSAEAAGLANLIALAVTPAGFAIVKTAQGIFANVAVSSGGGSGTPGGSNTQVQYNNNGSFAGITGATTDGAILTMTTPVINGLPTGTGVSTTSVASTLVARDANQNAYANDFTLQSTSTTTAGGTTTLNIASAAVQIFTGTLNQNLVFPDATILTVGKRFWVNNNSSGTITIKDNGSNTIYTAPAGGYVQANLLSNSSANGVWDFHPLAPTTVTWGSGTTGLVFNSALNTTATINAGASSSTVPVFIPQRGSATTGLGGDSTNLYLILGGSSKFSVNSSGHITTEGVTSTGSTGTGKLVFDTSPVFTTPSLGTVTSGTASTGFVIAGVTMTLGSDASGDMYYRNSSGVLTRIAAGAQNTVLTMGASSVPSWAAASGGFTPQLQYVTRFDVSASYTTGTGGTGAAVFAQSGQNSKVSTGATSGSFSYIVDQLTGGAGTATDLFARKVIFTTRVDFNAVGATYDAYFGMSIWDGSAIAGTGITFTQKQFGFKAVNGNLAGTNADGTTETATATLTTIASGDWLDLVAVFTPSVGVDYYWAKNGGTWSSATTNTTHLPTTGTSSFMSMVWAVSNHSTAANTAVLNKFGSFVS